MKTRSSKSSGHRNFQTSGTALLPLLALAAGLSLIQSASAVVVFSDNFNGPGSLPLNDRAPTVGTNWTSTTTDTGSTIVSGGNVTVVGATAAQTLAFGGFTQPLSASNPILMMTFDTAAITTGLNGISLLVGSSEKFFIGYRNIQNVYSVAGNGGGVGNNGTSAAGPGIYTFTYNYNTGLTQFQDSAGNMLVSKTGTANMAFDTVRLASGPGTSFALNDLSVQFVPEPGSAMLVVAGSVVALGRRRRA